MSEQLIETFMLDKVHTSSTVEIFPTATSKVLLPAYSGEFHAAIPPLMLGEWAETVYEPAESSSIEGTSLYRKDFVYEPVEEFMVTSNSFMSISVAPPPSDFTPIILSE